MHLVKEAIAEHTLPILHRLEQISSSEHIGTMAENVMEELKQNEKVAAEVTFTIMRFSVHCCG